MKIGIYKVYLKDGRFVLKKLGNVLVISISPEFLAVIVRKWPIK